MKKIIGIVLLSSFAAFSGQVTHWSDATHAFASGQGFHIVVDYSQCESQDPCSICDGIAIKGKSALQATSMSQDQNGIYIASVEPVTTIPEFVNVGAITNIVTKVALLPWNWSVSPFVVTNASIQVYSLDNQYVYSNLYMCTEGWGVNIWAS